MEIGCGRGGGLSYITKNFLPASAIGVDLDKLAVAFSGLRIVEGRTPCAWYLRDSSRGWKRCIVIVSKA